MTRRKTDVRKAARRILPLLLAVAALFLGACSTHQTLYPAVEKLARNGQYAEAAALVEKGKGEYGERNAVLYYMDRGILLHYAGRYAESIKAFAAAEQHTDALFTESVTGHVGAFLSNDNALPYPGEDFEVVLVNLYQALNYALLGKKDEALVEARKVNLKLEAINQRYEPGQKNVYREDAFARLLVGVLYEMSGSRDDVNDAFISDRMAAESYSKDFARRYGVDAPTALKLNLLTTAGFMGPEETAAASKRYPGVAAPTLSEKRRQGQLLVIHFAGRSPAKVQDDIRAVMPDGNLLKVAFPRYRPSPYTISGSRVRVGASPVAQLEPAQPIGAIAIENLKNRKDRISAKAIARATTKYLANKALQRQAGRRSDEARLLTFLAGTAYAEFSEQADLRSWRTLPDKVLMAQVAVAPGTHPVTVEFTAANGRTVSTRALGDLKVDAGQTRLVIVHTLQ